MNDADRRLLTIAAAAALGFIIIVLGTYAARMPIVLDDGPCCTQPDVTPNQGATP